MNQLISFTYEGIYLFLFIWFLALVKINLHEKFKIQFTMSKNVISLMHTLICIFNCLTMIAYSDTTLGENEPTYALAKAFTLRLSTAYFIYDTMNVVSNFQCDRMDVFYLYHHFVCIFALRENLMVNYKLYFFLSTEISNIFLFVSYYKTNSINKHKIVIKSFEKTLNALNNIDDEGKLTSNLIEEKKIQSETMRNTFQRLKQQESLLYDNLFFWNVIQLDVHIVMRCLVPSIINAINIVNSPNIYSLGKIILHPVQGIYIAGLYYTVVLKNNLYSTKED